MIEIDFEHYRKMRCDLIEALERGEQDKNSFIDANTEMYIHLELKEPKTIVSALDGLFYYQYYNTLAKHHQMRFRDLKYKDPFVAVDHRKLSEKLYAIKENITYRLLGAIDYKDLDAYYVKSDSKQLNRKLIEIVLVNEEKAILHSLDDRIIRSLKAKGLLSTEQRPSLIDSYINKRYYKV